MKRRHNSSLQLSPKASQENIAVSNFSTIKKPDLKEIRGSQIDKQSYASRVESQTKSNIVFKRSNISKVPNCNEINKQDLKNMHHKIEVLEKLTTLNQGGHMKQAKSEIRSKPMKAINSFDIDCYENTFNLPHLSTHKQSLNEQKAPRSNDLAQNSTTTSILSKFQTRIAQFKQKSTQRHKFSTDGSQDHPVNYQFDYIKS